MEISKEELEYLLEYIRIDEATVIEVVNKLKAEQKLDKLKRKNNVINEMLAKNSYNIGLIYAQMVDCEECLFDGRCNVPNCHLNCKDYINRYIDTGEV